jgi:hypothetical protein
MRNEPQFVEIRPVAQLRPAAATRTAGNLRPSFLLQQINATLGVEPVVHQRRDWMGWQFYAPVYIKKRAIGKARFEANCSEVCAICMETHTNGDSIVTEECNHCFGKQCWQNWMSNPNGNQTCPTCRQDRPKVISYTMKPERKKENENQEPMQMF